MPKKKRKRLDNLRTIELQKTTQLLKDAIAIMNHAAMTMEKLQLLKSQMGTHLHQLVSHLLKGKTERAMGMAKALHDVYQENDEKTQYIGAKPDN